MEIKNKLGAGECLYVHYKALRLVKEGEPYYYRYGQAVYNILSIEFQDLADEIHMTGLDTFYKDNVSSEKILFDKLTQEV